MTRMCCVCHKVEQGGEWLPLHTLAEETRVTHGYCPQCFAETMVQIEDFIGAKAVKTFAAARWPTASGLGGPCA
jgi:hypothetical protein